MPRVWGVGKWSDRKDSLQNGTVLRESNVSYIYDLDYASIFVRLAPILVRRWEQAMESKDVLKARGESKLVQQFEGASHPVHATFNSGYHYNFSDDVADDKVPCVNALILARGSKDHQPFRLEIYYQRDGDNKNWCHWVHDIDADTSWDIIRLDRSPGDDHGSPVRVIPDGVVSELQTRYLPALYLRYRKIGTDDTFVLGVDTWEGLSIHSSHAAKAATCINNGDIYYFGYYRSRDNHKTEAMYGSFPSHSPQGGKHWHQPLPLDDLLTNQSASVSGLRPIIPLGCHAISSKHESPTILTCRDDGTLGFYSIETDKEVDPSMATAKRIAGIAQCVPPVSAPVTGSLRAAIVDGVFPRLQVFMIDRLKYQIHWLSQTDGGLSDSYSPCFGPWKLLEALLPGTRQRPGSHFPKFKRVEPIVLGNADIYLFALSANDNLWVGQYHGERQYWEPMTLVAEFSPTSAIDDIYPGHTLDGRPQLFYVGRDGEEEIIGRVYLEDSEWTKESLLLEDI